MEYDVAVIGGGINGAAIAADAAGRGLRVFLCEKNDMASGTSSASSKLIHGGLRYLELFDFKLVRESLQERRILLQRSPNLVYPLSFVMPDNPACHSPWLIRLGLFLYDSLANDKQLPKSKRINLHDLPIPSHLKIETKGFMYTDCWGDDARLVIANLQLAQQKGATIAPRTALISAKREKKQWQITLASGKQITAKTLINATGPWVEQVNKLLVTHDEKAQSALTLVKGSHIIIKRFYAGDQAFILQNDDGRVIFLIPFQSDMLIVGTTDVVYEGRIEDVKIDATEIAYLKRIVENYFDITITSESIIASYSGVRPLYDHHPAKQAAKMTRDYFIQLDEIEGAPLITVYGGKLTTHRHLAEKVVKKLKTYFPTMTGEWTKTASLPGGEMPNYKQFFDACQGQFSWLPPTLLKRLARNYGTHIYRLLSDCQRLSDLGQYFGGDLYEKEIRYLIENEWAQTADDILWRRTKQGLYLTREEVIELDTYILNLLQKECCA